MAYQPHTLVTFGGTLAEEAADDEIWQCGIRGFTDGGGPVDDGDLDTLALHVLRGPTGSGGGLEGIWRDSDSRIASTAKLVWCKAANIAADGTYSAEPGTAEMTPVAGPVGGIAPSFCSVVLSWTTGLTLGMATRGRIYPPNYGCSIATGSKVLDADVTHQVAWAVKVLQCADTSLDTVVFHPYVVSKSGVSHVINGVRVGNVYDTQRRRKDKVAEAYSSAGFTP